MSFSSDEVIGDHVLSGRKTRSVKSIDLSRELGAAAIGTLGQAFRLDRAAQQSGILRRELPDLDLHIVNYGTLFGYLLLPAAGGAREQSHGRRQEWAPRLRSVQSRYRFVSILSDYGVL